MLYLTKKRSFKRLAAPAFSKEPLSRCKYTTIILYASIFSDFFTKKAANLVEACLEKDFLNKLKRFF